MAERENQGRPRTGKKRRRYKGNKKGNAPQVPAKPAVLCSMCEKPIEIISTAVSGFQKEEIAHLECVINHFEQSEKLNERQRVIYIGQGSFAVVEYRNEQKQGSFSIIKKIVHEDGERKKQLKLAIQDRLPSVKLL